MGFKGFLVIYRYFYEKDYSPFSDSGKNGLNHLRVQSLYYLLYRFGMDINLGDCSHGYTWSINKPHSNRLEADLCCIDAQRDEIKVFYRDEYSDEGLKTYLHSAVIEKLDLFKKIFFNKDVEKLLDKAKHSKGGWVTLLASIAFIKNCQMPYAELSKINKEIRRRGILWSDDKLNGEALALLQTVGIVMYNQSCLPC